MVCWDHLSSLHHHITGPSKALQVKIKVTLITILEANSLDLGNLIFKDNSLTAIQYAIQKSILVKAHILNFLSSLKL
jgi:hypothetical protein